MLKSDHIVVGHIGLASEVEMLPHGSTMIMINDQNEK